MSELGDVLTSARARARYSQDDVGAALGISRAMVSYWESGTRAPNDRQLSALARFYGVELAALVEPRPIEAAVDDLAAVLLRSAPEIEAVAAGGVRDFVRFLGRFAELAQVMNEPIRGLAQSPFVQRRQYVQKDDFRRKAREVRGHLGLGVGPTPDLGAVCEALGVAVYLASLGPDLSRAPSGAFLNHPDVGFAILVNADMTPGRRCFAIAHELAHALFHSREANHVLSMGFGPRERFANLFAGEFLMPSDGVRRYAEAIGLPPRLTDPVDIIPIQRYFGVSWPTALVRLRQMNAITQDTYAELRPSVQPESLARALGYPTHPGPYVHDPAMSPLQRFPRSFVRMLRQAVVTDVMSPPSAAAFAELPVPDIAHLISRPISDPGHASPQLEVEFREFEVTGAA